jgi:hypothetical protein
VGRCILAVPSDGLRIPLGEPDPRFPAPLEGHAGRMGIDSGVITVVGVITAAVAALVIGAAVAASERAGLAERRRGRRHGGGPAG